MEWSSSFRKSKIKMFNLKGLTNNKHLSFGFSQIKGWKNSGEEVLIADSHDNIGILQAKETEWKNWITDNVNEEVKDSGQKVISGGWFIRNSKTMR